MANNLALFTFNLLKIQKVQLTYNASSFSLFRSFYFFWFNFIFILFISLFFSGVHLFIYFIFQIQHLLFICFIYGL